MAKNNYLAQFVPEAYYHVFNRTNNREEMFSDDADRHFFLDQYKRFVLDYSDTLAYCLLPNHFHFALRIKPVDILLRLASEVPEVLRTVPQQKILTELDIDRYFHPLIERQFTRMFTAYAIYFNKKYKRSGNFFYRPFQRVAADEDAHRCWLIFYIHHNPQKHKVFEDFLTYPWSSYLSLISEKPTNLNRAAVWELFGSKEKFIAFHEGGEPEKPKNTHLEIED